MASVIGEVYLAALMNTATSTCTATYPLLATEPAAGAPSNRYPEFFRLPKSGGDPYFGLSRSHYYELERAGKLKLVRLRREGATRGVVLISYAAVKAIVETAAAGK